MAYNFNFEIAAIVIMLAVLIHFLIYRQLPLVRTRLFLLYTIVGLLSSTSNIISSIGCENPDSIPLWLTKITTFLVFSLAPTSGFIFFWYTIRMCEKDDNWRRKALWLGCIPLLGVQALVLTTPFTGFIYSFDADNIYHVGSCNSVCYLVLLGYIVLEFLLLVFYKKQIRRNSQIVIVLYTMIMMLGIGIQLYDRTLLLGGFSKALVIVLIYITLQNPGSLLDGVSDVYNELAFQSMVYDKLGHKHRFSVLYLHLNKFNGISSVIGYRNADMLLRQVGQFLLGIAGEKYTYRTESHVFALILPTESDFVEKVVKAIQGRFSGKWKTEKLELMLNANIVVAQSFEHFESVSEMNAFRDYLLKCAKQKGTNSLVYADEDLRQNHQRINSVERALNRTIEHNSIQVYYQAIRSMEEERLVAAEALARLHDEELGWVPPLEFIPIAERNGTIIKLGRQIFEKVCSFISEELVPNPELGIASIHINLSVVQCLQPDMADRFIEIMEKHGTPGHMINLELTERITLEATDLMRKHMEKLMAKGVKFSLDDYGTGSSNCEYLIDYSFSMVKFDKHMMDSYFENEVAHIILKNEFRTLKRLGMEIVAEGIESEDQVKKLKEESVDFIQGYYYAKPAQPSDFVALVRERKQHEGK